MTVGHNRRARMAAGAALGAAMLSLAPSPSVAQKPGAELKGLTVVGVVVEDLGSQAVACGLKQEVIEQAVSKILTDGGLKIVRNSDEDTYLYVNINTLGVPPNLCVSRFDATLYSHVTTKLSYSAEPVLVQVSLLHAGGMAGGATAGHSDNVVRNLKQYVEQFVSNIRAANR